MPIPPIHSFAVRAFLGDAIGKASGFEAAFNRVLIYRSIVSHRQR